MRSPKSLKSFMIFYSLAFIALLVGCFVLFFLLIVEPTIRKSTLDHSDVVFEKLTHEVSTAFGFGNWAGLERDLIQLVDTSSNIVSIRVYDESGEIVISDKETEIGSLIGDILSDSSYEVLRGRTLKPTGLIQDLEHHIEIREINSEEGLYLEGHRTLSRFGEKKGGVIIKFSAANMKDSIYKILLEYGILVLLLISAGLMCLYFLIEKGLNPISNTVQRFSTFPTTQSPRELLNYLDQEENNRPTVRDHYLKETLNIEESFNAHRSSLRDTTKAMIEGEDKLRRAKHFEIIAKTTQMLAHDVRKPFTMIKMIMKQIESSDSFEDVKQIIDFANQPVDDAIKSVHSMVQDVLDIGREVRRPCEVFDLRDLLIEAKSILINSQESRDVRFDVEWNGPTRIKGHREQFKRALTNILSNFMELPSLNTIRVSTENSADRDCFEVILGNDGPLVAESDLMKLFTPFHTKGKSGGTGLGLSIVEKIVTDHHGSVSCRSPGVYSPVEFVMTIPRSDDLPSSAISKTPLVQSLQ